MPIGLLRLLLFAVFLTVGATARAQVVQESAASQTFKQRLRGQYLQNDTAQAIINLYGARQGGGAGWIGAAVLAAVRVATASNSPTTTGGGYVVQDNSSNPAAALLVALPIVGYGAAKIARYSNGKLERTLADYAGGKPLASQLRRRLKPRFFAQPIIKYKPVK